MLGNSARRADAKRAALGWMLGERAQERRVSDSVSLFTLHLTVQRLLGRFWGQRRKQDSLRFSECVPGDSRWARPALLALLGTGLLSYTWAIQRGTLIGYYVGAVRTMSLSWKAFFFGGGDPGGWLTLDKLPGAFWVQALAARVFGFSVWTVIGPQVVEGVLTIFVCYCAVRRYGGAGSALLASTLLLVMPVSTALSRGNAPDALSTLLLVAAAAATLASLSDHHPWRLVLAGVWVGLAFQAKMIEAWLMLPVIALVYLVAASPPLLRRLRHLSCAVLVAVTVSVSWMIVVSLVPASRRPWFDGSRHNSVFEQVFVYNGLSRLTGDPSLGLRTSGTASGSRSGLLGLAQPVSMVNTAPSWNRMLFGGFALGFGWILPLALACGFLLLWLRRRAPRTDLVRASTLLWLSILVGHLIVFSSLQHLNPYYTAILVPPMGALVGVGAVQAWNDRAGLMSRGIVPAALALSTGFVIVLLGIAGPHWAWLRLTTTVIGSVAVILSLARLRMTQYRRGLTLAAAAAAVLALLVTPAVGSIAMDTHEGGPYSFAFSQRDLGSWSQPGETSLRQRYRRAAENVLDYVEPRTQGMRYLLATGGSVPAATLIAATDRAVLPIGGYSGQMPTPTLSQLVQLVTARQLRFFLVDARSHNPRLRWVAQNCRRVVGYQMKSEISGTKAPLFDCGYVSPARS